MRTTLKPLLRGGAAAAAIAITLFGTAQQSQAATTNVFQELFLSLDVSGSISNDDFALYRQGYVNAFSNATVRGNVQDTFAGGGLAIAVGQWNTRAFSPPVIDWRHITTLTELDSFVTALGSMTRQQFSPPIVDGWTCIDCGMKAAIAEVKNNQYVSTRANGRVIDISTDGEGNTVFGGVGGAASLATASAASQVQRADAELNQIIINGLAVDRVGTAAEDFLTANVVTGLTPTTKAGFVEVAKGVTEFESAITRKLIREVGPGPGDSVPGPLPVLGAAAAFGFSRKLRRRINTANLHQA